MKRRSFAPRDQAPSGFAGPLGRLCDALPALASAIVDAEGETIDYAGGFEPYRIKVAAAELQLLLAELQRARFAGFCGSQELLLRARTATYVGIRLMEGYTLVIALSPRAFSLSHRALNEAMRELSLEAELEVPERYRGEEWSRIDVEDDGTTAHRPQRIWLDRSWSPVIVLGRYHGRELLRREVAYRIRLENGQEATVVRERLGKWYADRLVVS